MLSMCRKLVPRQPPWRGQAWGSARVALISRSASTQNLPQAMVSKRSAGQGQPRAQRQERACAGSGSTRMCAAPPAPAPRLRGPLCRPPVAAHAHGPEAGGAVQAAAPQPHREELLSVRAADAADGRLLSMLCGVQVLRQAGQAHTHALLHLRNRLHELWLAPRCAQAPRW